MTKKQFIKQLTKHKNEISKQRDGLRDLLDEANEIVDNCTEALEDLECAIGALSRWL